MIKYQYYPNGEVQYLTYVNDKGLIHREDGPAYFYYTEDGNLKFQAYYINGKRHRTDGPAEISYYEGTNIINYQCWRKNDNQYREDGPAYIEYYPDGTKSEEVYLKDWMYYNYAGPTIIRYNKNGKIRERIYHYRNMIISDIARKIIKDLKLPRNPDIWDQHQKDMFQFHLISEVK